MKITFFCNTCVEYSAKQGGVTAEMGGTGAIKVVPNHMTIKNNFLYNYECEKGHKNSVLVTNLKFQIIFESGLNAYHEGYYAEAVGSFYAALENFYREMTIYFFVLDKEIPITDIKKILKINKSSERKLGMFHSMYMKLLKKIAPVFPEDYVKLRNDTVHGTKYPTESETLEFGNEIRKYIWSIVLAVQAKFPDIDSDMYKSQLWITDECHYYEGLTERYHAGYILSFAYNKGNRGLEIKDLLEYTPFWQNLKPPKNR